MEDGDFMSGRFTRLCLIVLALAGAGEIEAKEWTDAQGRKLEGEMLGVERRCAVVEMAGKRRVSLPLGQLSAADQQWVKDWGKGRTPAQQLPLPQWPLTVQQSEIRLTGGAVADGRFEFRSPHYKFDCDAEVSVPVMSDFATVAEGTLRLLYALPVQFAPLEDKLFYARICQNRASYERGGGVQGSAGVFITSSMSGEGVLLVPFQSLGIEQFNGHNTKSYDYNATVLTHEMTHQATAELLQLMPKWVAEGLAEYVGRMPYHNGVFYLGARDRVQMLRQRLDLYDGYTRQEQEQIRVMTSSTRSGSEPRTKTAALPESWIMRPSELVQLDDKAWSTLGGRTVQVRVHRMYLSSMFLVHYFLHLADKGEARRIRLYFEELNKDAKWFKQLGRRRRGEGFDAESGSDGSEGGMGEPPAFLLQQRMSLAEIRNHYVSILVQASDLKALDADFHAQYIALGFHLPEWK